MQKYTVKGMSCAACSARVEKAVTKIADVDTCTVSLLTNSMQVEGAAKPADVIAAVRAAGYDAAPIGDGREDGGGGADNEPKAEIKGLQLRLLWSLLFLGLLVYLSMGVGMLSLPLPGGLAENPMGQGILQLLLTLIIMVINRRFFTSGFKGLWHLSPNMDSLVAIGAGAAFVYSTLALLQMSAAWARGDVAGGSALASEFYFESAGMILTLITLGKLLEATAKGKTTDALKSLAELAPQRATLLIDGVEQEVAVSAVKVGDIFVVRPGDSIPVDGVVVDGFSAVNEAALTGEAMPQDKQAGDEVSAATLNTSGFLTCRAVRVGEDTALAQIIRLVSEAAGGKAKIAKLADRVSGVFVPTVMAIAAVVAAAWLIAGYDSGFALARGIAVLVISCPCALGLATPVAIMVASGLGAKHGILFKTATALEETGKADIVALDKTGTLTVGEPVVTDILPLGDVGEAELLALAATLEQKSEHPLGRAVVAAAKSRGIVPKNSTDFAAVPGMGLKARLDDAELFGGSVAYLESLGLLAGEAGELAARLSRAGKTPLLFAREDRLLGIIAVADRLREDSKAAVRELKALGIRVVMLTGDNAETAAAIGREAEVDEIFAELLPQDKEKKIRELKNDGRVVMVGDGINDAPALTSADIGVAIGAGTAVAIDAAEVVLLKNSLFDVVAAIRLSRATLRDIKQNLFWAFAYNTAGIPLAAGCFIPFGGWELNPMFAAAAMSLSSFCVVSNALRLNTFKLYPDVYSATKGLAKLPEMSDNRQSDVEMNVVENIKSNEEEKTMEVVMKISGMMCSHCEGRVKKALENLPEVSEAKVSHTAGEARVSLSCEVADDVLRAAVEAQDYEVLECTRG